MAALVLASAASLLRASDKVCGVYTSIIEFNSRAARDAAYIDPIDINRALLKTLSLAATLDRSRANKPEG